MLASHASAKAAKRELVELLCFAAIAFRSKPGLHPTSVNPAPIKNDGHPSRDDGNAQCDGGRHFTDGAAGPLDLMGADPSVQ